MLSGCRGAEPLPQCGEQEHRQGPPHPLPTPARRGARWGWAPCNSSLRVEGTSFKGTWSCQHLTASEAGRRKHIHTHPQPRDRLADRRGEREAEQGLHHITAAGGSRAPSRLQGCLLPSSATCARRGQPSRVSARKALGFLVSTRDLSQGRGTAQPAGVLWHLW